MKNHIQISRSGILGVLVAFGLTFSAHAQTLIPVSEGSLPEVGNFYLASLAGDSFPGGPPVPFFPYAGCNVQVYSMDGSTNTFWVDDFEFLAEYNQMMENEEIPPFPEDDEGGGGESGGGGNEQTGFNFSTNDVWLELKGVTNDFAYLTLHNSSNHFWQLQIKTALESPEWELGQIIDLRTNSVSETNFLPVYTGHQPVRFYRAQGADDVIGLGGGGTISEDTNDFDVRVVITFCRSGSNLLAQTVHYRISGSATYGLDYTNDPAPGSNLTGSITIPQFEGSCGVDPSPGKVYVYPL